MLEKRQIFFVIFILLIFTSIFIYIYYSTNCKVSDWSACDGTKITRTVVEATFGGTACTAEQNVTEKKCNDCIVSDWGACDGTKRTRTFKEATNGGTACTAEQKDISQNYTNCTNCTVSDWSACDGTKRTRTVKEATDGGIDCTADQKDTSQNCTNCTVSDWSACNGNKQTRTVKEATNGGTSCTAEQNATITEKCCVDLVCSSNYSIIKDYYDKKGEWVGVFTMEPTNSNKVSETLCDVAYNYNFVPGGGRNDNGTDKRRFTLSADNTNCAKILWNVTAMDEYNSGITV
jgi:hypothetical protein